MDSERFISHALFYPKNSHTMNKKLNLIGLIALCLLFLASCKAPMYVMGMDEQTFLQHNNVTAVEQTENYSVYKKVNYPFGAPAVVRFFYFKNGKLFRVDNGVRQPDVIIDQHVTTN